MPSENPGVIYNFIIDTPTYHIYRYQAAINLSDIIVGNRFFALCKTQYEVSVISDDHLEGYQEREEGWKLLSIEGKLAFEMTGVIASIASLLAREEISIFVVSSYDTDHILVKSERLEETVRLLQREGHRIFFKK